MKQVKWNELTVGRDYHLQDTKSVLRFIRSDDKYVYFQAITNIDSYIPNDDDLMYFLIKQDYSFYELPLKLGTHIGTIKKSDYGFYFYPKDVYCGDFFYTKDIHKIKYDLQKECLGYTDNSGSFPYCKSKADVIKFINFLNDRYPEGKEVKGEVVRKIAHTQGQMIIRSACTNWQDKLISKWSRNIALAQEIEVPESFYQEMRKACTSEQHKLFDEIFGVDCPFKKGELIAVRNTSGLWILRYFSHMRGTQYACFDAQEKSGPTTDWRNALSTNGLILPD